MKILKKEKAFVILIICLLLSMTFSIPVLAATNSFSKPIRLTTNKKTSFSLGSFSGGDIQVTQVKIYINMSSGSDRPYAVYLESPSGTVVKLIPSVHSGTYSINSFNGENPKGTWYAWLEMEEDAPIESMTANATVTVTYSY